MRDSFCLKSSAMTAEAPAPIMHIFLALLSTSIAFPTLSPESTVSVS
jgi:hypothetical protein